MSEKYFQKVPSTRWCIAYGGHISHEHRDDIEAVMRQHGWFVIGWAVDDRPALTRPLSERPGAVRALVRGLTLGVPVVLADLRDMRSPVELLKYATAGEALGVEVHKSDGRVVDEQGCADEMDFALHTWVREMFTVREAVLSGSRQVVRPQLWSQVLAPWHGLVAGS